MYKYKSHKVCTPEGGIRIQRNSSTHHYTTNLEPNAHNQSHGETHRHNIDYKVDWLYFVSSQGLLAYCNVTLVKFPDHHTRGELAATC